MKIDFNSRRRAMLQSSAAAVAAAPFVGALQALSMRGARAAAKASVAGPYGPIRPVADQVTGLPLLQLPEGFNYKSFSWAGDRMDGGQPVPARHDGMAVVGERKGADGPEIVLVRNHEVAGGPIIDAPAKYDTATVPIKGALASLGGGTTNVYFPRDIGRDAMTRPSLGGTLVNCAGGPTPWGSWLSCEETLADFSQSGGRKHGYVFEVTADPARTTGKPIVGMGRFSHEAVAVDPKTSNVYLTQDDRNRSAIYRYLPVDASGRPGSLAAGGRLQAAKVKGVNNASLLTAKLGDSYEIEWIDIADPDADPQNVAMPDASGAVAGPFVQAWNAGALRMSRGEGCCHYNGRIYVVDTSTGVDAGGRRGWGDGAVWELDLAMMKLKAIFVSTDPVAGNNPDNITVGPRGGVLLCEDGGGVDDEFGFGERLMGVLPDGRSYVFCKNNVQLSAQGIEKTGKKAAPGDYREFEFCGATFDPSGHFLFVNIQTPGITFAIWGPWSRGYL